MTALPFYSCTFDIDPAAISTAQQKKISFRTRRIFTNKKVAAGMRAVKLLALPHARAVQSIVPDGTPVSLSVTFFYAYPKGTPKKRLVDNAPMPQGADLDNRFKSFGDALTSAGWWTDDRVISALILRKRRTTGAPRIDLIVSPDC